MPGYYESLIDVRQGRVTVRFDLERLSVDRIAEAIRQHATYDVLKVGPVRVAP